MSDPPDGGTPEAPSTATTATSSATDDPEADRGGDSRPSVADAAGIDEKVLDVPHKLASIVRLQWIIRSTIIVAVLGVLASAIAYGIGMVTTSLTGTIEAATTVGATVFLLCALIGVVRAVLLYRSWRYVVRADSLYLGRGVFTRVRTVVPYVRVQHMDTKRSPLERLLGLSTLVVYTAGSRGADVTIPGLTPDRASTLQQRLERLTIESEEADAV